MITYREFLRSGYKLLKKDKDRKEIKKLFLDAFKSNELGSISIYMLHLYDIFFRPEKIFFDGYIYVKNEDLEENIKYEFANFFLKEHIEDFLALYPILRDKDIETLDRYLPIVIRFLPEAKPEPRYFIALYLILADVLITVDKKNITDFRERFINLSTKGFARYRVKVEVFDNIINDVYLSKAKGYMEELSPYNSFLMYYLKTLEDFEKTLQIGRFNNEFALFLIFSNFIFEDSNYKDLLKEIRERIKLDLIDKLIGSFKLEVNKERLKGNIKNLLT